MLDMKEKPKRKKAVPVDAPRERAGANLNVWLPAELLAAFESLREKHRRTKTAEVIVMMEHYLSSAGLWPPKP